MMKNGILVHFRFSTAMTYGGALRWFKNRYAID